MVHAFSITASLLMAVTDLASNICFNDLDINYFIVAVILVLNILLNLSHLVHFNNDVIT